MTVAELMQLLAVLPSDTPVLVSGYESGYDELDSANIQAKTVVRDDSHARYEGEFEDAAYREGQRISCIVLGRKSG